MPHVAALSAGGSVLLTPTPADVQIRHDSGSGLTTALPWPDDVARHPPPLLYERGFLRSYCRRYRRPWLATAHIWWVCIVLRGGLERMPAQGEPNLATARNIRCLSRQHAPVIIGQWPLPVFPASNAPQQLPPSGSPSATAKSSAWSIAFALCVLPIFVRSFQAVRSSFYGG